MNNSKTVVNVI